MAIKSRALLNKKIYFFGLNPTQAIAGAIVIVVALLLFGIIGFIITLLPIIFLGSKVAKQNKSGNPDYFKSLLDNSAVRKDYTDTNHLTQYLLK